MNHEISFSVLMKVLKKCWWQLALIGLCAMLIMATITVCFIPKKYSSSMDVYVVNSNVSSDYTTSSLLSANSYLINDYIAIIKGDIMLKSVCDQLKTEAPTYKDASGNSVLDEAQLSVIDALTPGQLRSMISSNVSEESSIFKLSVSHTDPEIAYVIARKIAKLAPASVTDVVKKSDVNRRPVIAEQIYDAMKHFQLKDDTENSPSVDEIITFLERYGIGLVREECIDIISDPKLSTTHDSPNLLTYTLLAGIAALAIAYAAFLLSTLSKSVIVTEEDIRKNLDYPLIGVIPHWSSGSKGSKYYGKGAKYYEKCSRYQRGVSKYYGGGPKA